MQIKAEQTMKLAKILINQNNKLYNQIKCICQDLEHTDINLCDIETLSKSNDKILGLRTKIQKIKNYFNNLQQKRQLLKCNTEINDKSSNVNYKQNISNQQNRKHNNQQIVSSLRQLLFKQKKNNYILTNQLQQYSIKIKQLKTTNKLLTESNINYQGKRAVIKEELLLYKNKYAELMNLIIKTRNNTLSNTKIILKQLRKEQQQCKKSNNQPFSFKKHKQNIELHVSKQQSIKQWSNSLFRHVKPSRIKRSVSCILNDVFVDQIDSYQKQQQTQVNISNLVIQQSFNQPFSINYSVIHPN